MEITLLSKEDLQELIKESVNQAIKAINPINNEPKHYSRVEVCELLHVSLQTLHNYQKKGILIPKKIGNRVLYDAQQVEAAIEKKEIFRYKH